MDRRADFNGGPAGMPHTGRYLWGHVISLCEALRARRIVDIGCGNGALCGELANHGYEVVGCEQSAESLHFAHRGAPGLVFHRLGVEDDPSVIGNESFDVAIATEVIEHLVTPFNLPSIRDATASAWRLPDYQYSVSRLPEKSYSCIDQ
jgi:2-polyprenyl-3-methyl-5-hydroxy-6-metoxy-1,4-benzoquinol methylase